MLITVNEFIYSGVPISTDISDAEISLAILTVEDFYLKEKITDQNYIDLTQNPTSATNYILINGGVIDDVKYAGLKNALYHLVYAYLMMDTYRISRYASVEKTSEFSKSVTREDLFNQARVHWDIGNAFVQEVQKYYNLPLTNDTNTIFETLLF